MGRGLRHRPDRAGGAAGGLGPPGGPAATLPSPPALPRSLLQQNIAAEQSNPGGAQFVPAEKHPPRKRSWGLSGAGLGYVPWFPAPAASVQPAPSQRRSSLRPQSCALPACTHSGTVKPPASTTPHRQPHRQPQRLDAHHPDTATTSLPRICTSLPQRCPFLIGSGRRSEPPSPQLLASASQRVWAPHLTGLSDS